MSVSSTAPMAVLESVSRRNSRGMRRKADTSRRRGRSLHMVQMHGEVGSGQQLALRKAIIMDCLLCGTACLIFVISFLYGNSSLWLITCSRNSSCFHQQPAC